MIILAKNFSTHDNHIIVKPIAQINDNQVVLIDKENENKIFPNSGKIYTPNPLQKLTPGNFAIYRLEPSITFVEDNEGSHFYSVKEIKRLATLFEVFFIEESFRNDTDKIVEKIQNGFINKVESLKEIILCTSDGYMLGPFKVDYDHESKLLKIKNNFEVEKYITPVYSNISNPLNIVSYYDKYDETERNFTTECLNENNKVDELDIATNEYIVYETIKTLRGQEEFGDITRRVSQGIKEWIKEITFSEEHNIKRLKKTVELIKEVTPDERDSNYKKYKEELLSLPSIQHLIEQKKEEKFKLEYEEFLKEHKNLMGKNRELNKNNLELTENLSNNARNLKLIKGNIKKYSDFMSHKKKMIEEDILNHYFQQLITNNLSVGHSIDVSYICKKESEEIYQQYDNIKEMKKTFKFNLKQYEERDSNNEIFDYCLLSLMFNQPLIIVGEASLKLADIIKKTFSASNCQTILPETNQFNLNMLNDIKNEENSTLKFTSVHNIHVSPAALNLFGLFSEYESENNNNKMIFTFDSFNESRFVLEQLHAYAILDIQNRAFLPSPFKDRDSISFGQISSEVLTEGFSPVLTYEKSLEELLEVVVEDDLIEREEEIERVLKSSYRRLLYVNQFLGNATKSIKYFPFLNNIVEDDEIG